MLSAGHRPGLVAIWEKGSGVCRKSLSNLMETGNRQGLSLWGCTARDRGGKRGLGDACHVLLTAKPHTDSPSPSSAQRCLLVPY